MTPNPIEHENIKINLKPNNILRENICAGKMNFYLSQFDEFKMIYQNLGEQSITYQSETIQNHHNLTILLLPLLTPLVLPTY